MSTLRKIAVIDIGKTNAKVVLIDMASGEQLAVRSTPNTVLAGGLYPHADTERLWAFILDALRDLNQGFGADGISITTHGATAALMAGDAVALPVLDYEFTGPDETRAAYDAVRPAFAESLSPPLPVGLNLGAQIYWQQQRFPDQFATVTDILMYPQYWAWRLTGMKASEVTSLGCHTDLWSPDRQTFSTLVVTQGWTRLFPAIKPAASVLGPILPALAAETGLAAGTPVTVGIHDSNASLLPHLRDGDLPETILSTGTWAICMTLGGDTATLDASRDSLANVDAFGRAVPTARFMAGREFDHLVPEPEEPTDADLANVIARDVQVLPAFAPGMGPLGSRAGSWTGAPDTLSRRERTAAVSLYLALMTRECLKYSGIGKRIVLEGPLARNRAFGRALAQLVDVPVFASGDATGTTLGAAMLFEGVQIAPKTPARIEPLGLAGLADYAASWTQRVS